jgi:hypothetical protein
MNACNHGFSALQDLGLCRAMRGTLVVNCGGWITERVKQTSGEMWRVAKLTVSAKHIRTFKSPRGIARSRTSITDRSITIKSLIKMSGKIVSYFLHLLLLGPPNLETWTYMVMRTKFSIFTEIIED